MQLESTLDENAVAAASGGIRPLEWPPMSFSA
jgi:hypothetical protein